MNNDVANVLSRILTWNNIVPTGSPSSQLIAFWANKKTFEAINKIATERDLKFSVYVDDLSFSSELKQIPRNLPFLVNSRLQKIGLQLKKTKTTFFGAKKFKIVTGVGINKSHKLAIPNHKQKKIIDLLKTRNEKTDPSTAKSIFGSIVSNRQMIPCFMNNAYLELKKEIYPNKNG